MTSNTFSINCDELKKKVRSIRAGHLPAEDVIDAILKASADYDATEAEQVLYWIKQYLTNDEDRVGRYSEALQMEVQIMANRNGAWLMDDLRRLAQEFAVFDLYPNARQYWFGLSEDIVEDHNQWMECIFKKTNKTRIYNRIKKLLGDLLRSDFLNKEYADFIGIPPEEIDEARQELKDFGFDDTYVDLAKALSPTTRGRNLKTFSDARNILGKALHGKIEFDEGRQEWVFHDEQNQIHSVSVTSEGIKKLSIIAIY